MDNGVMLAPGELIAVQGSRYHVRRFGAGPERREGPAMLLETGLTMMSGCWGWLGPALGQFGEVIAYDRAGLGWSEERAGRRDARQCAAELSEIVKALGLSKPLVLVGHSMGALINRAFARQHPEQVCALAWLDPAHPEQALKSGRMRAFFFLLECAHRLAAHNLPAIPLSIEPHLDGLPERELHALRRFLRDARHLRTCTREARAWKYSAEDLRAVKVGSMPLLVLSAQKNALRGSAAYQKELTQLSSRAHQVIFTDASHLSLLADEEHAGRAAAEIGAFLEQLPELRRAG